MLFAQIERLRLSRDEVVKTFASDRAHPPGEARMLEWQGYESVEQLARHLRGKR